MRWMGALKESKQVTDGQPGQGTRFEDVFEDHGQRFEIEAEIVEFTPPEVIKLELEGSAFESVVTQTLAEKDGKTHAHDDDRHRVPQRPRAAHERRRHRARAEAARGRPRAAQAAARDLVEPRERLGRVAECPVNHAPPRAAGDLGLVGRVPQLLPLGGVRHEAGLDEARRDVRPVEPGQVGAAYEAVVLRARRRRAPSAGRARRGVSTRAARRPSSPCASRGRASRGRAWTSSSSRPRGCG